MCIDYRALNALLPQVTNPTTKAKGVLTFVLLPRNDDLLGQLRGTAVFGALDVTMGYHHMGLMPEAQQKTTPLGKFKFNKCPFGLAQAPAYFQSLIFRVLQGLNFTFAYLDDVLIFSKDVDTHLGHLRQVFEWFRQADLHLKKVKCDFFKRELQYLGHILSPEGIRPLPDKLSAIRDLRRPTNAMEVHQFLGLTGYYRKFVPHYSTTAKSLSHLTKKDLPFEWNAATGKAFCLLRDLLQKPPILIYPDPAKPYVLFTDASKVAWGAVLMQEKEDTSPAAVVTALPQSPDGKATDPQSLIRLAQEVCSVRDKAKAERHLYPITFCSEQFQGSQLNWAALTKEAYAIFCSLHKLCFYTKDTEVTIMSDHLPLKHFLQKNTASAIVNNWAISLEEFRLTFEYVPGKCNLLADAMSHLVAQELAETPDPEPFGYEFSKYLFKPTPESQKYKKAKEQQATLQAFASGVKYHPHTAVARREHCRNAILSAMQGLGFTQDPEVLDYLRLPVDGSPPPATMPINQELDAAKFLPEGFTTSELITYQREDDFCQEQLERIESDKAPTQVIPFFYLDEDQRLCRKIKTGYKVFDTLVIPTKLVPLVLDQFHHLTGHNGTPQTFEFTRRLCWWPSMLHDIKAACKRCPSGQQMNCMPQQYHALSLHMPSQPLQLVAMDLIGPFTETSASH